MRGYEAHYSTLTLESPDAYAECQAVYQVDVNYYRGRVEDVISASLVSWTFNGRPQSRSIAVSLLGNDEVTRQEEIAVTEYRDSQPGWVAAE